MPRDDSPDTLGQSAPLREKAVAIIRALGEEPATPAQARELLGVKKLH